MNKLREKYKFPEVKPNVPEVLNRNGEPDGWFHGDCRNHIKELCTTETQVVVVGGCWMGQTEYLIRQYAPNAMIISIDHWGGSAEHQVREFAKSVRSLYETFCANLWGHREYIIPLRMNSIAGLKEVADHNIVPDLIYVDWSHDELSVANDTYTASLLFPDSIICGDDWTWGSVKAGVRQTATILKRDVYSSHAYWRFV
jgi:hypothetical protein